MYRSVAQLFLGDLMGRAYPRLEQILPCVFKENA